MSSYLIYVPGVRGCNPQHLVDAGLTGLTGDNCCSWEAADVIERGPDGSIGGSGYGMVFRFVDSRKPGSPPRLGNFPDQQTWTPQKVIDGQTPRWWLGRENGKAITPHDLERPRLFQGPLVTLADGHSWQIPVARLMPHISGLTPGGQFERRCRREYRGYFEAAEAQFKALLDSYDPATDMLHWEPADLWPFSCAALALNYHLTPELIDQLEILEDESHFGIVRAATELDLAVRLFGQKKSPDPSPTPAT